MKRLLSLSLLLLSLPIMTVNSPINKTINPDNVPVTTSPVGQMGALNYVSTLVASHPIIVCGPATVAVAINPAVWPISTAAIFAAVYNYKETE